MDDQTLARMTETEQVTRAAYDACAEVDRWGRAAFAYGYLVRLALDEGGLRRDVFTAAVHGLNLAIAEGMEDGQIR